MDLEGTHKEAGRKRNRTFNLEILAFVTARSVVFGAEGKEEKGGGKARGRTKENQTRSGVSLRGERSQEASPRAGDEGAGTLRLSSVW